MNQVADDIVAVLSPVIGQGLAMSAVNMECTKLGILPEELSEKNIDEFSEHFQKIMQIFAGEQTANEIVMKIRTMVKK